MVSKIEYFNGHLNNSTASLSKGYNSVCAFVNDRVDRKNIKIL